MKSHNWKDINYKEKLIKEKGEVKFVKVPKYIHILISEKS